MTKRSLFLSFVRTVRGCFRVLESFLGWFFPKDRISAKYSPSYLQQEIWKTEYQIWETNKTEFLSKAQPRSCPACDSTDHSLLWNSEDGYRYVQCRVCDFVHVTPFFSYDLWREYFKHFENDIDTINRRIIDSRFQENYIDEDRARFSFYLRLLRKHKPTGSVLDIGCLTGSFLKFSQELGYRPSGIEYREYAIEAAKKNFGLVLTRGFFEEIASSMIQSGQRFDIITLWETLEHMLYPKLVIQNSHQLLSPGGLIAISVPNFDNLQVKILRERCFHCLGGPGNAGHINMFTPTTLSRMLEENGFKVVFMETEGSSSYYDILAYLSGRHELINSYSNAILPSRKEPSHHPFFLSPTFMNFALALSPVFSLVENAFLKGAVILTIARKNGT
jgi:2-polyprenyl-3-methyl-5-hydroxy-6-metoxy-1,4-benzoquinol methylase